MDGPRFDRLARLVARRSRRQVLRGLAGAATAALFSRPASVHAACDPPCAVNASCTDGNTCVCDAGYEGNPFGIFCSDINECADGNACGPNAICTNTTGSFDCSCEPGYQGSPPGTACTDVDECTNGSNPCDPNATCTNTPGSFDCACNTGFTGDGLTSGSGCEPEQGPSPQPTGGTSPPPPPPPKKKRKKKKKKKKKR